MWSVKGEGVHEMTMNDHVVTWTETYFASDQKKDCVNSQFEQLHDKFLDMKKCMNISK